MMTWLFLLSIANASELPAPQEGVDVLGKIQTARAEISEDDRHQREATSHLFLINKKIKTIAKRQEQLTQKMLSDESAVRGLAQEVQQLEARQVTQTEVLNRRLQRLYQTPDLGGFQWLFSAETPVELERNQRFLSRMVESDHNQLKTYLNNLVEVKKKRASLKLAVTRLASMRHQVAAQERELSVQMQEKFRYINMIKQARDSKLDELKGLRSKHNELNEVVSYAFFERKGQLRSPVAALVTREFGTFVDPQFRFTLTHKGLFYGGLNSEVRAVFHGRVAFAGQLPGYGRAVILDHGDNYFSLYAFASKLRVKEGTSVREGELLGYSGGNSPLFGPGVYFEIRHFTDAIDPRPWIKESLIKTADSRNGESL